MTKGFTSSRRVGVLRGGKRATPKEKKGVEGQEQFKAQQDVRIATTTVVQSSFQERMDPLVVSCQGSTHAWCSVPESIRVNSSNFLCTSFECWVEGSMSSWYVRFTSKYKDLVPSQGIEQTQRGT